MRTAGVACKTPVAPLHGTVYGGQSNYEDGGSPAKYSCKNSFYLNGASSVSCGKDGNFDAPTCLKCTDVLHCNEIRCSSGTDQHCNTKEDCQPGYTKNTNCDGVCSLRCVYIRGVRDTDTRT